MPDSETASSTTEASQYEPDRARIQRIVEKVDSNANGKIDVSEAKELLCMVLGIPENDVPDDHEDVIEFSGLSTAAMVDRLCEEAERGHVNAYYDALFPAAADVGGGGREQRATRVRSLLPARPRPNVLPPRRTLHPPSKAAAVRVAW